MSVLDELKKHLATLTPEQFEKEWAEIEALGMKGPTVKEFLANQKPVYPDNYWEKDKFKVWMQKNGIKRIGHSFFDKNNKIICELRQELYHLCETGYDADKK